MIKMITSSSCVAVAPEFGQTTTLVPVLEQNSNNRMRSSWLVRSVSPVSNIPACAVPSLSLHF